LATASLAFGGMNVVKSMTAADAVRITSANRKVNLACVGIGNRGVAQNGFGIQFYLGIIL
jgi:hypothetical protein